MATGFPLLGILGGGQLGRMTALAAIRMGLRVRTLSPAPAGPVEGLGETMVGDWRDPAVLAAFADGCSAVTVESEWAPAELLVPVAPADCRVFPTPETLRTVRHKGVQKDTLVAAGIPNAQYVRARTLDEAGAAARDLGFPVVVKRFEGSYDGYGNGTARSDEDMAALWEKLSGGDGLLVEAFVDFRQELSVLVARRDDGVHAVYPVAGTEQRDHRCHAVTVPADLSEAAAAEARRVAVAAAEAVGSVGILGVELFQARNGQILVNELAPRPHNTGHYTIDGSHTSQFENHVRAVLGWPLGDPALRDRCAVMVNVLGNRSAPVSGASLPDALAVYGASVHLYGKKEVRPRRKMGHVTVTGHDPADVRARAEAAVEALNL